MVLLFHVGSLVGGGGSWIGVGGSLIGGGLVWYIYIMHAFLIGLYLDEYLLLKQSTKGDWNIDGATNLKLKQSEGSNKIKINNWE